MNILKGMTIFAEVTKQQGFAPAARELNLSTSAVSRYVIDLEKWLGVQLLQRTTRKLSLTEEGIEYLDRCLKVIADVDEIKKIALKTQTEPEGRLKITAPTFIVKDVLQDILPGYLSNYPKIDIEITAVDRFVNIVEEGFDLGIRAGELTDSTLIARRLMNVGLVMIASPIYLEKNGEPKAIEELKNHNCLIDTVANYSDHWPLHDGKKPRTVKVSGNVRINNGEIIRTLAVAGQGIALIPRFMVIKQLKSGELLSLLEDSIVFEGGLFAIYPQRQFLSVNVRSFIDYLVAHVDQLKARYDGF